MPPNASKRDLRETGIPLLGQMPWGTHLCYFYETNRDLLDVLMPYFKTGLENNEFCLWVIFDWGTLEEARSALGQGLPDLDRHLAERRLEIVSHREWYLGEVTSIFTESSLAGIRRLRTPWRGALLE